MDIEICFYCGAEIGEGEYAQQKHMDHYIPKSKGGDSGKHNIVPSCASCNLDKRSMKPGEWKDKCQTGAYLAIARLRWLIGSEAVDRIDTLLTGHFNRIPLMGSPGIGIRE